VDLRAKAAEAHGAFMQAAGMSRAEAKAMQGWIDELRGALAEAEA
jgi:hypothetical protein